jgi:ribosomal protein S18 acetylase RimI-like enzyme
MIEIVELQKAHFDDAAALFITKFKQLRQTIPVLPGTMEELRQIVEKLDALSKISPGLTALENGQVVGYIGWYIVERFRGTERTGAYVPVWGHGSVEKYGSSIYNALYRAASTQWAAARCGVHAISLLANDHAAEKTWYWNGFGLGVVDAIRPIHPLEVEGLGKLEIRKAQMDDAETLAVLEAEHLQHYTLPPIFMARPRPPENSSGFQEFLKNPLNSIWLAEVHGIPAGFIRFEGRSFGATEIVQSDTTIAITGAYTRPESRGQRAAVSILDAALKDYAAQGYERCSVDFEAFNPEAAHFWMKYFQPVCFALMRHPEVS